MNKTKLIFIAAFAAFGAAMMWISVATGYNDWDKPSASSDFVSHAISIVAGAYIGNWLTRGESAGVRLLAMIASILTLIALVWFAQVLDLAGWVAHGPVWHAALFGFVLCGGSAAVALNGLTRK